MGNLSLISRESRSVDTIIYELVSYFVLALILSPYFQNSHGMGAMTRVQSASNVVAQPTPRV